MGRGFSNFTDAILSTNTTAWLKTPFRFYKFTFSHVQLHTAHLS
jgi:hypothetical protein